MTWEDQIKGMEPQQAIDYLIGKLEALSPSKEQYWQFPRCKRLSPRERRLIRLMATVAGPVPHERLYQCIYMEDEPEHNTPVSTLLGSIIKRMRRKLPAGVKILTDYGVGYELVNLTNNPWPWEVQK